MSSDIKVEIVSAHALSDDLKRACGWCDQNGHYNTGVVSIGSLTLRKWLEMAIQLETILQDMEAGGTDDR